MKNGYQLGFPRPLDKGIVEFWMLQNGRRLRLFFRRKIVDRTQWFFFSALGLTFLFSFCVIFSENHRVKIYVLIIGKII